jgi:hypothetical protein
MGAIPRPHPEPALQDADPGRSTYCYFVDDDFGRADSFERLVQYLHHHYFPRLAWAHLSLSPRKSCFFLNNVEILGHARTPNGIRPSVDKVAAFRA